MNLNQCCESVAEGIENRGEGFKFIEILPIITGLVPLLFKLFESCGKKKEDPEPTPVQLSKYVNERYDQETGEYDHVLFASVMNKAKRQARKERKKLSRKQLRIVAKETLDQARTMSALSLSAVCAEASTVQVSQDDLFVE
jgi:hypothetical protein